MRRTASEVRSGDRQGRSSGPVSWGEKEGMTKVGVDIKDLEKGSEGVLQPSRWQRGRPPARSDEGGSKNPATGQEWVATDNAETVRSGWGGVAAHVRTGKKFHSL